MNKDYIRGYQQGYKEGKRLGGFVMGNDLLYIAGNVALSMADKGMSCELITEIMNDMRERWNDNLVPPEEFIKIVKERTGVEFGLKEEK